ncbi:MAG TPA: S8 family serine peptidase [Ignavibacteria bacterium]|nr:S8 family serine peptidase [Ignavibacteria bacterium]
MKIKLILFFFFAFSIFSSSSAYSQTQQIIVKLKKDASAEVFNNFVNENPRAGTSDIARLCAQLNITTSKQLFKKILPQLNAFDNSGNFELDRIFILNIQRENLSSALTLLSGSKEVEYVQLNNQLKLEVNSSTAFTPNDTYYSQQYYLRTTGLENVWNTTKGDSNVLVGVIDSGLDFLHPDLQTSFKINPGETGLDAQGRDKRFNGIDDENNGFIDDWRGWDFVDAPFTGDPRRGDYLNPDNNPEDDNKFSHGTAVTGIINATFNNGLGISSVAPDCKVLVMRAFDAEGQGEEDDVANAVLYGLIQGVKVFNFSFGDYVFSNMLRDVVEFAYQNNAVIITSAGNDGGFRLHYPSAYDEVISVAASDENDFKAGFSSYGETVDIYAPGFQILTTTRTGKGSSEFGGNYEKFNGTSFAAPQVAAIAALLISQNNNLTNEEIRGLLVSTTTYLGGQTSWTGRFASGRINALNALNNINFTSIARIFYPSQDYTFYDSSIPVCISAASPLFQSYSLYYGIGELPDNWIPLQSNVSNQVLNDTVYNWNTSSLNDTSYTLRLAINSSSGRTIEHRMIIFKDSAAPVITDVAFGLLIDKNTFSELILFNTDKRSVGKIYYRPASSSEPYKQILADLGTPNIGFVSQTHFAILPGNTLEQNIPYSFYLEATSLNGKTVTLSDKDFNFTTGNAINVYGYDKKNYSLPYSQSCQRIIDINNNGKPDIFLNEIKNNLQLNVFELSNGSFTKISNNNWTDFHIARDLADIDSDNKYELLVSKSRNGIVYKAPGKNELPTNIIWSDTAQNNFWSARFADSDNDGKTEIMGFGTNGLRILEYVNGDFNQTASLAYHGIIEPVANSQNVLIEDFNNNGRKEIVFINTYYFSGDALPDLALNVYENTTDNNYQRVYTDSMSRFLKGDNIIAGDFDGDGIKEFALGTVSKDGEPIQYYSLVVYKANGGSYHVMAIQDIYNYKSYTETSTRAANVDADSKDEILINTGTHFYILKYNNLTTTFEPILYKSDINTFNQIAYDFDADGINEIGLNTVNDTLLFFQKNTVFAGPPTPLNLRGHSEDSNKANITFDAVQGAEYYKIYRSNNDTNFILIDSTFKPTYTDNNVSNKTYYYYKVSAIDTSLTVKESNLTNSLSVYVHNKSRLLSATYQGSGFVLLKFSEQVQYTIPDFNKFVLQDTALFPASVAVNNPFEYLLKYNGLRQGAHNIVTRNLVDLYNSQVSENSVSFVVSDSVVDEFYIQNAILLNNKQIKVEFNTAVNFGTAKEIINYRFTPFNITVDLIGRDTSNAKIIYVNLGSGTIGATGKNYVLKISNVFSSDGIKITEGPGSTFGFVFNKQDLEDVYVYPNPFKIGSTAAMLTFANLTVKAKIEIFDLTGRYLRTVEETDGNGGVEWDLKDDKGKEVSSGIYLFRATGFNSENVEVKEKIGKFAVIK